VLYDADSRARLAVASAAHVSTTPPVSEQDPESWWQAFGQALTRACALARCTPSAISAISIAAQHHGLVALGPDAEVLRPAKLWNDTTSAPQAERLLRLVGPAEWVRRTGSVPTSAFTVTKLAWLAEREPVAFERMTMALLPHDWLTLQLTGVPVTDRADASGTGYFDPVADVWCEELLAHIDPHRDWLSQLPEVRGPQAAAGLACTERAAAIGLTSDTLVGPGTGDQSAAALGLGIELGDVVISLGTSGVVTGLSPRQVANTAGLVNGTASASGSFQPAVITLNAAKVTDTFARLLAVDQESFAGLALAADRHEHRRPILVPYLDGERTPNRPFARGVLADLGSAATREELALCVVEGVVLGLLRGRQALADTGMPMNGRLLVTGGAANSAAYRQVLASLSGEPVHMPSAEGDAMSARGAAVQAAAVLFGAPVGQIASAWAPKLRVVADPQPGDRGYAAERNARYSTVNSVSSQLDRPPDINGSEISSVQGPRA
jgi:xylulokinase